MGSAGSGGLESRKEFADLNLDSLNDADPRAMKALEQLRNAWNNAPVVSSLNGSRIRIPGFIVPLENQRGQVTEFLLVPYFGACIHTPPPPLQSDHSRAAVETLEDRADDGCRVGQRRPGDDTFRHGDG